MDKTSLVYVIANEGAVRRPRVRTPRSPTHYVQFPNRGELPEYFVKDIVSRGELSAPHSPIHVSHESLAPASIRYRV